MSAQSPSKRGLYTHKNPFGYNVTKESKKKYRQRVRKRFKAELRHSLDQKRG